MSARPKIVLPLVAAATLIALSIATQIVAHDFHYPREFGRGLLDVGRLRIYAPWAFVGWYGRFAAAGTGGLGPQSSADDLGETRRAERHRSRPQGLSPG